MRELDRREAKRKAELKELKDYLSNYDPFTGDLIPNKFQRRERFTVEPNNNDDDIIR